MEPWEVMTSESQERMLAIVTPEVWPRWPRSARRWEVRATVVGRVTEPPVRGRAPVGRLRILDGPDGAVLADVPAASLADDAPLYRPPAGRPGRPRRPGRPTPGARAGRRLRRRTFWPCWRPGLGLPPVRPPAVLEHRGGPGRRRRPAAPGRPGAARQRAGHGGDHRLQPPLVRPRPAGRHRHGRGRVRGQPGLRREPAPSPSSTASTSATPSTPRSCGSSPRRSTAWPRPAAPSACR